MGNNAEKQDSTPKGSSQGTDYDWALDYINEFIKSPIWSHQVQSFVDENCLVFDNEEESRHCHHDIWKEFNKLVEDVLAKYVNSLGLTLSQFIAAVDGGGKQDVVDSILKYTRCCDDFMAFKKMMLHRNVELEREALAIIYNRPSVQQELNDLSEEDLIELAIKRSLEQKREEDEFERAIRESKLDNQQKGDPKASCSPINDESTDVIPRVEGEVGEEGRSPSISKLSDKKDTPPPPLAEADPQELPPEKSPVVDVPETETFIEVDEIPGKAPTKSGESSLRGNVKLSSELPNLCTKLPPLTGDIGKMRLPTLTAEDIAKIEQRQSQMRAHIIPKKDTINDSSSPGLRTWASQTPKELEKRKQFLLKQKKLLLKNKQLDRAKKLREYDTAKLVDAVENTTDPGLKSTPGEPTEEDRNRLEIRKALAERFKNDFHI